MASETPSSRRRRLVRLAAYAVGVVAGLTTLRTRSANSGRPTAAHAPFLAHAQRMRELASNNGDQPYGAVVVRGDTVIAAAPSRVVSRGDPTAHAEMEALREAAAKLGTRNLSGCTLYGSSPPCAMCESAAYWANVDEVRSSGSGHAPRYGGC